MDQEFKVTVQNGNGDEVEVRIKVREGRSPTQYAGPAILKARRVIPDVKPWSVGQFTEA